MTSPMIHDRQKREKALLVEQLRKIPIVQVACEKTGIARATYYRWRKDDDAFAQAADEAITDGVQLVNDMAESQLLSAIRDANLGAITYWLKHRHPAYNTRLDIRSTPGQTPGQLTHDEEIAITNALRLASLLPPPMGHDQ